jgi:hypothetical protein
MAPVATTHSSKGNVSKYEWLILKGLMGEGDRVSVIISAMISQRRMSTKDNVEGKNIGVVGINITAKAREVGGIHF